MGLLRIEARPPGALVSALSTSPTEFPLPVMDALQVAMQYAIYFFKS